jgi:hypothetical protein
MLPAILAKFTETDDEGFHPWSEMATAAVAGADALLDELERKT